MREQIKNYEDVENVAQTIRTTIEWLDNRTHTRDSWPAFKIPLTLFLDIYKASALPRADAKLRPGDQPSYYSAEH